MLKRTPLPILAALAAACTSTAPERVDEAPLRRSAAAIAHRLADATEVQQVMLRGRLMADAPNASAPAKALYVLTAWYTDHQTEARLAARALALEHPGSAYRHWPEKMERTPGGAELEPDVIDAEPAR